MFSFAQLIHVLTGRVSRGSQIEEYDPARMLRRTLSNFEEAGIAEVEFMACNDERDTPFERAMNGRRMTVKEARKLLAEHEAEMPRATFRGMVEF